MMSRTLPMEEASLAHVRSEVNKRLQSGKIRRWTGPHTFCSSPIGTVSKSNGKLRTIHHLSWPRSGAGSSVNEGISPEDATLTYSTLDRLFDSIQQSIRKGTSISLWKADLADAFRHCVVSDRDANLLDFTFDAHQYIDTRLPFGCRSSPFLFNLFAGALHWMLEQRSITLSHYLDDFFGATNGEAEKTLQVFKSLSQTLGLSVQDKKLEHGHALEILGILVDARRGTASISEERRRGILHTLDTTLSRKTATALELMSVAEHLVFISRICPPWSSFPAPHLRCRNQLAPSTTAPHSLLGDLGSPVVEGRAAGLGRNTALE